MAHGTNKGSLVKQISDTLADKTAFGQSKYQAKQDRTAGDYIYSFSTLETYMKHCNYFAKWCRDNPAITAELGHKARTLDEIRPYAGQWISARIDAGLSPYTIKLEAAALTKLYGRSAEDLQLPPTPERKRQDITRSRGDVTRDKHFSETKNARLITFCKNTGLRRRELAELCYKDIRYDYGQMEILVRNGKGGKQRIVPVLDPDAVLRLRPDLLSGEPEAHVWDKVHSGADIHAYRADYATALYESLARPLDVLSRKEKYYCRGDLKGIVYDKNAMLQVSRALGHNRINVIAEHYLWGGSGGGR